MNWQEACADPSLTDLPYKIELNQWGQTIMSPADYQHWDPPNNLSWFA
jgi:hypothetical protein